MTSRWGKTRTIQPANEPNEQSDDIELKNLEVNRFRVAGLGILAQLPSSQALGSSFGASLTRKRLLEMGRKKTSWHRDPHAVLENSAVVNIELKEYTNEANMDDQNQQFKKRKHIRDMPTSIPVKRAVRDNLLKAPVKSLSGFSGWRYRRKLGWNKFKIRMREVGSALEVWRGSFKTVEGHFGTGVVSYFVFLKWLFFLNVYIFLLTFIFIVLPQFTFETSGYTSAVTGVLAAALNLTNGTDTTSTPANVVLAMNCTLNYVVNVTQDWQYLALDFLQGTGWMEKTELFMGHYSDQELTIGEFNSDTYGYNMPLAYLMVTGAFLILSLILLVYHTASGLKQTLVNSEDKYYQYCNKVFGGWDFALTDDHAAELKHKGLYNEIVGDIAEARDQERRKNRTNCQFCGIVSLRILINLFVLAILGASGYLIYYSQFKIAEITGDEVTYNTYHTFVQLLIQYTPSLTITILNVIVPAIFEKIVRGEDYSPAFEVQITLIRIVFLRLASVAVLVGTIYTTITCSTSPKDHCGVGTGECVSIQCWETYVGQQLYKLVIMDFLAGVGVTLLVEFPRKLIVTKCVCGLTKMIGQQQFVITKNVLDLVYSQTLCWLGTFFSPLIPAIYVFKMFILFYLKKVSLLVNMRPPDRPYRASKSNSFFMFVLLLAFTICCFPVGWCIARLNPSKGCGPFRIYTYMFEIVTHVIAQWPVWLQDVYHFITSAGFACPAFIILVLIIYYYSVLASARKSMVKLMKEQLALEGRDKQFLLARISELTGTVGDGKSKTVKKAKTQNQINGNVLTKRSGSSVHESQVSVRDTIETPPNVPYNIYDEKNFGITS